MLIAGAGPVGLTLANELVRLGVRVRIVDKAAARTDKSKALVLWSRTLELFDDAGYAAAFLPFGILAHGAEISTGRELIAQVPFDAIDSRFPHALMIPQSETERVLEERLGSAGVEVERRVELTGFADKGDEVEATVLGPSGVEERVTAEWLIGCDGAHSTVRHGLGLAFEGETLQSDWVLADGLISGLDHKDRIQIFWHRDGILACFPIGADRWRVVADLGPAEGEGKRADPTVPEVQALLTGRGKSGLTFANPFWLAAFRINERKVKDYRRGCVFLAGDAAHIHSPAGGQGMNTGMQDAFNLAWKLAMVIEGRARASLLDSYSPERSAVGERVLRNAGRLTEMAVMRNPIAQGLRNAVVRFATGFPAIQHRIADQLTEMDIGYPESPLSRGPKAGVRWPHRLPAGAGGARFTAVGPAAAVEALAAGYPGLVVAAPEQGSTLLLIRPDGYVGFAGGPGDQPQADSYLAALAP
ncbi:MAG: FAD-dependent monooxygenase [Enhydrobacter sp.]|nr:MAG: FAD-dependent monooxygenase [Enhydrobacter sp.]